MAVPFLGSIRRAWLGIAHFSGRVKFIDGGKTVAMGGGLAASRARKCSRHNGALNPGGVYLGASGNAEPWQWLNVIKFVVVTTGAEIFQLQRQERKLDGMEMRRKNIFPISPLFNK